MMRRLIAGAAVTWLVAVACGDDGVVTPGTATGDDAGAAGAESAGGGDGAAGEPAEMTGGAGGLPPLGVGGAAGIGGEGGSGGVGGGEQTGDLRGRVKTGGRPAAGAVVLADGRSTVADDSGAFVLRDVAESYQLVVIDPQAFVIKVYDGLSTRTPVLNLFAGVRLPDRSASMSGKLSGAAIPLPAGHAGAVTFAHPDMGALGEAKLASSAAAYSLASVAWAGSDSISAQLQALSWKTGPTAPQAFVGFASRALDIAHNDMLGPSVDTNLELADPVDTTVGGSLTLPPEFNVDASSLIVGSAWVPIQLGAGEFSLTVPEVDVGTSLMTRMVRDGGGGVATLFSPRPSSGAWELRPPTPPRLALPVMNAQAVTTTTEFSFTGAPAETVVAFTWWVGDWAVTRVTLEETTTLPDVTAQGIVFTNGVTNLWSVDGIGPAATVDDYLRMDDALARLDAETSYWVVASEAREFVLAE